MQKIIHLKSGPIFPEGYDGLCRHHYTFSEILPELHDHDFYEVFLVVKGSVQHEINGLMQELGPGHLVFIRPWDHHRYQKSKNIDCQLINFAFPEFLIQEIFDYLKIDNERQKIDSLKMPPSLILSDIEIKLIVSLYDKMHTLPLEDVSLFNTEFRILSIELITKFFRQGIRENYNNNMPEWLSILCKKMAEKENFLMGMERLKDLANKSHEHLSRSFKKHLNISPSAFLNDLKLNYAANLLARTDMPVTQIAFEAGFENLGYFYSLFREKYTSTPRQFKKKNQVDEI